MKSEAENTSDLVAELERLGAWCFKTCGNRFQKSGVPDLYIHHIWFQGWIEFKNPDNVVSDIQRETISQLNNRIAGSAFIAMFMHGNIAPYRLCICSNGKQWGDEIRANDLSTLARNFLSWLQIARTRAEANDYD
jgi:hypothetical protein